jgi:cytochrome c-type biogenesis protein CcmF
MEVNETHNIKGYDFTFKGVTNFSYENYQGHKGLIDISYNGDKIASLEPEKRQYVTGMPMTEAAIDPSLYRDLYVALGEPLNNGAWSLRLYYKPLIRFIWLGGLFIVFGALLAAFDRRYSLRKRS